LYFLWKWHLSTRSLYIETAMIPAARNIFSMFLLCFYIAGGALIELTHHDALSFATRSHHAFEQHDCGQHERHVAPEAFCCLACTQTNKRVAIETQLFAPHQNIFVVLGQSGPSIEPILEADILHSGKRGPPSPIV
jgi:hypothetical protein